VKCRSSVAVQVVILPSPFRDAWASEDKRVRGQPHPENAGQVTGRQELFPDYSQEVIGRLRWRQREPGIPLKSKQGERAASHILQLSTRHRAHQKVLPAHSGAFRPPRASSLAIEKASLEERALPEERRDNDLSRKSAPGARLAELWFYDLRAPRTVPFSFDCRRFAALRLGLVMRKVPLP